MFVSCGRGCESVLWLQKPPKICDYVVFQERETLPWMKELSMGRHFPFVWFLSPLKHPWLCLLQYPCSEVSSTIVVTEHTPSREEDGTKRFGVHLWHLISLFAQELSYGSCVCWLLLLWFFRAAERGKRYREYASVHLVWLLLLLGLELSHYPLPLEWCLLYGGKVFLCLL